jgi:enolase-phosphatase E1
MIKAILTDIEGTTSSLSFVKDVLFPYARAELPDYIRTHAKDTEVRKQLEEVSAVVGQELDDEAIIEQLIRWIDEDRKITPLKNLQGRIWESGYRNGDFRGHVYPDAVRNLHLWHESGLSLYIFSSGSVQAQRLLFAHSEAGDLTPLFSGYFDTQVGGKLEAVSYRLIAGTLELQPGEILFLSDIEGELDAASQAGLETCQLVRPGTVPSVRHALAVDFDAIELA